MPRNIYEKNIYIPNPKFKAYLLEHFDRDNDGEISVKEAQTVRSINCNRLSLFDIDGIDQSTRLEFLNCNTVSLSKPTPTIFKK